MDILSVSSPLRWYPCFYSSPEHGPRFIPLRFKMFPSATVVLLHAWHTAKFQLLATYNLRWIEHSSGKHLPSLQSRFSPSPFPPQDLVFPHFSPFVSLDEIHPSCPSSIFVFPSHSGSLSPFPFILLPYPCFLTFSFSLTWSLHFPSPPHPLCLTFFRSIILYKKIQACWLGGSVPALM